MTTTQTYPPIEAGQLVAAVTRLKQDGWRLVQISATRLPEHVELTYSFDRDLALSNLRLVVPAPGARIPSISSVYWCAFLYENEIHDLFDVGVDGLAVDFHGKLYKTTVPFPFAAAPKARRPAPRPIPAQGAPAAPVAPTEQPVRPAASSAVSPASQGSSS